MYFLTVKNCATIFTRFLSLGVLFFHCVTDRVFECHALSPFFSKALWFLIAVLYSTVIFRSTYVMSEQNWLCWQWGDDTQVQGHWFCCILCGTFSEVLCSPGPWRFCVLHRGTQRGWGAELRCSPALLAKPMALCAALNCAPTRRKRVLIALGIGELIEWTGLYLTQ